MFSGEKARYLAIYDYHRLMKYGKANALKTHRLLFAQRLL
jgi:hypothetical protein